MAKPLLPLVADVNMLLAVLSLNQLAARWIWCVSLQTKMLQHNKEEFRKRMIKLAMVFSLLRSKGLQNKITPAENSLNKRLLNHKTIILLQLRRSAVHPTRPIWWH